MVLNAIKGLLKIVPGILKVIPLALKALIFMVTTLPKMIFKQIQYQMRFLTKAIPLAFAVIVCFVLIFFGLQYIIQELGGYSGMVPHLPLAIFTLVIIQQLVMETPDVLKYIQRYLLALFLLIFNNSLLKDLFGFDVKIDKRNPTKSFVKILTWCGKNIIKIIIIIFVIGYLVKFSIRKIWKYITFYMSE